MPLLLVTFVAIGASLLAPTASAAPVSVRSSFPVRVLNQRRIQFLDAGSTLLRARLVTHGYRRIQRFEVQAPVALVRIGRHALRGKDGRWMRAHTVRLATQAPPQQSLPPAMPRPAIPAPAIPAPRPPIVSSLPLMAPSSASSFLDSVGVNVHMSYVDTSYNDWQQVRDKLVELGVHHVRDAACPGCTAQRQRLLALAASGIGVDFTMQRPGSTMSLTDLVNMVAGPMRSAVDAVEGPNEYDHSGDPDWVANLRAYQQQLYSLVRAAPSLDGVPVIGPSLVSASSFAALGDLSSAMDWGNSHPYAGGQMPASTLSYNAGLESAVGPSKPMAATEAGYHNAMNATSGQPPVSEQAAGDYVPRLFLDMFRAGVPRTYLYELLDERADPGQTAPESDFGLLRSDFSEKPAFRTLESLLHLTGPVGGIDLTPLHLEVNGPADLRQLLLQTGPRSYALVLWRDVKVWDQSSRSPIAVSPANAQVQLGPEVTHAELHYVDDSQPAQTITGTEAAVALSGVPVVLALAI